MKKFKFKLANVLKYRETLEQLAKQEYRDAVQVVNRERDKLVELRNQQNSMKSVFNIEAGAVVDPEMLSMASFYMGRLFALMEEQKKIIAQKEIILQEKFKAWNEKRKEVKVIKRLEEKQWSTYQREVDKEDQKIQDELFIAKKLMMARQA